MFFPNAKLTSSTEYIIPVVKTQEAISQETKEYQIVWYSHYCNWSQSSLY